MLFSPPLAVPMCSKLQQSCHLSEETMKLPIESSATSFSQGEGERAPVTTRWLFSATSSKLSGREGVKIFNRQGVLSRRSGEIHTLEVDGKNSGYFRSVRATVFTAFSVLHTICEPKISEWKQHLVCRTLFRNVAHY